MCCQHGSMCVFVVAVARKEALSLGYLPHFQAGIDKKIMLYCMCMLQNPHARPPKKLGTISPGLYLFLPSTCGPTLVGTMRDTRLLLFDSLCWHMYLFRFVILDFLTVVSIFRTKSWILVKSIYIQFCNIHIYMHLHMHT